MISWVEPLFNIGNLKEPSPKDSVPTSPMATGNVFVSILNLPCIVLKCIHIQISNVMTRINGSF